MNFLFQFLIDRSIDRSYGKWSTPVLNNSLSCIAQKVTFSNVFLFISLLRQKKNPLPPFAMERLGSICSYGNNDSRFKIWRYTFYHFRSYSTWKIVAISAHCIMEIRHRIFHRFFPFKKRDQNAAEEQQRQLRGRRSCRGVRVFCFHCTFWQSKEVASMYKNVNHCSHRLQTDGTDG